MVASNTKYARLNRDEITKLQELEKEIGKVIIAYEPVNTIANMSEDQLRRLQQFEQELGVILVAYKKT